MKILIAAHGYPPREPGVWTSHLAQHLAARHSVWVYARTTDNDRSEFVQFEERHHDVTVRRVVWNRFDPSHDFDSFRAHHIDRGFLGFVDEIQPDIVHIEHIFGLSATMLDGLRQRGIPFVWSLYDFWLVCQRAFLLREDGSACAGPSHAFDCFTCVEGGAGAPSATPSRWRLHLHDYRVDLMHEMLSSAAVVTACSPFLRDRITSVMGLPEGRVRSVALGTPALRGAVARTTASRLRIGYIGSVVEHKGVAVLAAAAAALADLNVEVHLYGSGDPRLYARLLTVCPTLTFHGGYSRDALPSILGDIDILAVPSLASETFSFVIREAALADVAVVASRTGAIPDYLSDGETGLLVTPGSAAELAQALRRLVLDPALRNRLATTHAPIRSVEDYAAEMEGIYGSLV